MALRMLVAWLPNARGLVPWRSERLYLVPVAWCIVALTARAVGTRCLVLADAKALVHDARCAWLGALVLGLLVSQARDA